MILIARCEGRHHAPWPRPIAIRRAAMNAIINLDLSRLRLCVPQDACSLQGGTCCLDNFKRTANEINRRRENSRRRFFVLRFDFRECGATDSTQDCDACNEGSIPSIPTEGPNRGRSVVVITAGFRPVNEGSIPFAPISIFNFKSEV